MATNDEILAAAWRCFESSGATGFSLRRVAADIGLTPMALYRHFENRQALLDALVLDATEEWRARVAAVATAPPADWLHSIAEAYLDFALERPHRFEAAFLVRSLLALRYPEDFFAGASPALELQFALAKDLTESRTSRPDDAAIALVTMIAIAQGLVTLYRAGRISGGEADFRRLYHKAIERFLRSLAPELAR